MSAVIERFDRVFPRTADGAESKRLYQVLTRLPDRILLVLMSIFVASYLMAEFSLYKPYTVIPLALVFIALTWRLVPSDIVPSRAHALGAALAVLLAIVWVVVQLPFETQFVVASRDPGIYSNLGAALARTGTSTIDVSKAITEAAGIPNATANLGVFHYLPTRNVQLQGGNALPSLLGIGYWIGGINGLTVVNSVVGGVALVGVFSLGRRILGPLWSFVPPLVLGLSMPMVYFSRAPYTEILNLTMFVGALIWFWGALATGCRRDFLAAGILAGAACMTRIDAVLGVAALIGAFVVILVGVGRPRTNYDLRVSYVVYVVPAVVLGLFGSYDLLHNFHNYVLSLGSQSKSLWALGSGVTVLGFVVIGVRTLLARVGSRATGSRASGHRATREGGSVAVTGGLGRPLGDGPARVIAVILAVIVPLAFLYLAVRPHFIHDHYNSGANIEAFVSGLEAQAGLPIDPTRSFDEYSLYWFVWYFGIPFVFAVAIGMSALVYRAVRSRRSGLLVFAVMTFGVAVLYLNQINIAPDQMWAFRRVLPIVAPGFIIAAAYLMKWLGSLRNRVAIGAAGAIAALVVGGTIGAWNPRLFITTEYSNQANELTTICQHIGDAKNAILIDRGPNSYALSIKDFCGVDTFSVYTNGVVPESAAKMQQQLTDTQASLKQLASRLGTGTPVIVFDRTLLNWQGTPPNDVQSTIIDTWNRTLLNQPHGYDVSTRTTWMGTLLSSGLVKGEQ